MTYRNLKRKVLELINQYSVAGTEISPDYNNQSDYILRIPSLINDAILRIRTEAKPLVYSCSLTGGQKYGDMRLYVLPEKYRAIKTGGVYRMMDGTFEPTANYRLFGERGVLLPDDGASYEVEYYGSPEYLSAAPHDNAEINEDAEVLAAACYYAAAMLIWDDNEFGYALLYNEYQSRANGMASPPTAEISGIRDVYGLY